MLWWMREIDKMFEQVVDNMLHVTTCHRVLMHRYRDFFSTRFWTVYWALK